MPGEGRLFVVVFILGLTEGAAAQCPEPSKLRNPYFGDTHIHTALSMDANTQDTRMSPLEAHDFARGVKVPVRPFDPETGQALRHFQLARPLDWVAVSDHAEFLGEIAICDPRYNQEQRHPAYDSPECQLFRQRPDQAFLVFNFLLATGWPAIPSEDRTIPRFPFCGVDGQTCVQAGLELWREAQDAAHQANDSPTREGCDFTAFVGYEYSGSPSTRNLHRNVIFRNDRVPEIPTGYMSAPEPELLWKALDGDGPRGCTAGCDVLTIPHNSNLSNGILFETQKSNGKPFDLAYATTRAAKEPLVEIFQHKGDSECFQGRGPGKNDELCGFEKFPYNNLIADRFDGLMTGPPRERDFVRDALKTGLVLERELGVNPFRYGIIASTDTHQGAPGSVVEDGKYFGHGGAGPASRGTIPPGVQDSPGFNPGGLAVVWAEQNTRDAIFDAMKRREAYGTSGPRIRVRFFGGWDLPSETCNADEPDHAVARAGYDPQSHAAPMGGSLPPRPQSELSPRFAVFAARDPGHPGTPPDPGIPGDLGAFAEPSVPLERIQIVKGWVDSDGKTHEQVFDVAGADDGAAIDPDTCAFDTEKGHDELCTVWEDPKFDPDSPAFYYARVVQNPTCRWLTLQCNAGRASGAFGCGGDSVPEEWQACCDPQWPKTIRERAWTSPIWYAASAQ